ncbi:hypothetical protein NGA_2044000, partial [Nannochloropsis gaditana CCMP526]|uniref:uncharacterized protein n=1 Tax=Nannochloropsis gaditana (strain CCMP526) TaxID=1093141 RepID=UPI00029F7C1E
FSSKLCTNITRTRVFTRSWRRGPLTWSPWPSRSPSPPGSSPSWTGAASPPATMRSPASLSPTTCTGGACGGTAWPGSTASSSSSTGASPATGSSSPSRTRWRCGPFTQSGWASATRSWAPSSGTRWWRGSWPGIARASTGYPSTGKSLPRISPRGSCAG